MRSLIRCPRGKGAGVAHPVPAAPADEVKVLPERQSDPEWQKPDNFIMIEILYFLARNRKRKGETGLEGYFSCRRVADELQRMGYIPEDTLSALNVALQRQLISADHMNFTCVDFDDSVHILASGFMHVRVLAARIEYLYGVIPTTPIIDRDVAARLSEFVKNENARGRAFSHQRLQAVEIFHSYLVRQKRAMETPFSASGDNGASYVLGQIEGAIEHFKNIVYKTAPNAMEAALRCIAAEPALSRDLKDIAARSLDGA